MLLSGSPIRRVPTLMLDSDVSDPAGLFGGSLGQGAEQPMRYLPQPTQKEKQTKRCITNYIRARKRKYMSKNHMPLIRMAIKTKQKE